MNSKFIFLLLLVLVLCCLYYGKENYHGCNEIDCEGCKNDIECTNLTAGKNKWCRWDDMNERCYKIFSQRSEWRS